MNSALQTVISASDAERRDLFLGAAARLGTAVQNVEKDFWVCWTLDALFNGLETGGPRLLFKGGTLRIPIKTGRQRYRLGAGPVAMMTE